tara:strand:- start:1283 stop:3025 length:1743 start_codon:yes stop_codon:yes gene_type:complete
MCGIIACVGENVDRLAVEGLKRLEYRGYDSYGFAWVTGPDSAIQTRKSLEPLEDLGDRLPRCSAVIGHTRWATHGNVSLENCHPHSAQDNSFSLVHNGIVENFQELRKGDDACAGKSDTAVIVQLLDVALGVAASRREALCEVLDKLGGRNTILVLFSDGEILAARHGSPLLLGRTDSQYFLSSDLLSFVSYSSLYSPIPERHLVQIQEKSIALYDTSLRQFDIEWVEVEVPEADFSKDGHPHYMLKEVMEQWQTVSRQAKSASTDLDKFVMELAQRGNLLLTGAGGAFYTCMQIAWLLREVTGLKALAVPAYEIDSLNALYAQGDLVLAISQSGETADTIRAVERAASWGMRVASLVNMPMSTLARVSEFSFANDSGPEICVLSTKSATAQVTFGYILAQRLNGQDGGAAIDQLSHNLSQYLGQALSWKIREVAMAVASAPSIFILGRGLFYPCAMVAALNIKEASYVHAEAFAAGELKHGVIALIEKGVPVMLYVDRDDSYMLNVASEVKSRGAHIIGIACEDNELFDDFIPIPNLFDPLLAAICGLIPGQFMAYHLGIHAGVNPDRPRNLAKSVTVQ